MKSNKVPLTSCFVLCMTLTATSYANEINNSFDRDMNRQATPSSEVKVKRESRLPEQDAVNRAIRDREQDPHTVVNQIETK